MRTRLAIMAAALAAGVGAWGQGALAATLTFDDWTSTNSDWLAPVVTVSDDIVGQFDVTVRLLAPDEGSLIGAYFDIGGFAVSEADIIYSNFSHSVFQANTSNLGGSMNINGLKAGEFTFALGYDKKARIGVTELTFSVSDLGGALSLSDWSRVALRFQQSNNDAGSDKLLASAPTLSAVPLPGAAWLLLGAIGSLASIRRIRSV